MLNPNSLHVSDLVLQQVPLFIRENHQKFVDFLTNYYEYLDQDQKINDYIRNIVSYMDVDSTTEYLLSNFFEELKDLPGNLVVDKRLLIKHIHDLYDTKGTIKSLELLFRILFGEEIEVDFPSKYILRASDGIWKQEVFITISMVGGELPINGTVVDIQFENSNGKFKLTPTRIVSDEVFDNGTVNTYRVFFNANDRIFIEDDQLFMVFDINSTRTFLGRLTKSPSNIVIISGGKYWQYGAVFSIPGERLDTICRVVGISSEGIITKIEILQYGMGHTENQSIVISPFRNRPSGSATTLDSVLVSYNPTVYTHTLTINDYTDGIIDSVVGLSSKQDMNSYFMDDYVDLTYNGQISFVTKNSVGVAAQVSEDDVTVEQWLDSRTTLVFEHKNIAKTKGEFSSDRGKLSNPLIRIQDNKFYQLYSYVIKTEQHIHAYKNALSIVHPAGTKFFAELQRTFEYDTSDVMSADRNMSVDRLLLNDIIESFDDIGKSASKTLADTQSQTDDIGKSMNKPISDTQSQTDDINKTASKTLVDTQSQTDDIGKTTSKDFIDSLTQTDDISKSASKDFIDSLTQTDDISKSASKTLVDTQSQTDDVVRASAIVLTDEYTQNESFGKVVTKYQTDSLTQTDVIGKTASKPLTDTIVSTMTDNVELTFTSFTEAGYFLEEYIQEEPQLTIT